MNKFKNTKGITLISLIITIIILVILAGASINLMIGQDGSINNVKNAEEKYEEQQNTRQETLNELKTEFENYNKNLPQNTQDNPQDVGTEVSLKDEWTIETINYIKTSNGEEITDLTKIATVYAISVGGGETIPVPKGFYYVGGNLITGTQWDVILNKLIDKAGLTRSDIVTLSSWGNYRDTSITYNGMLSITDYNVTNSGNWTIKPFSAVTTGTTTSYGNDNTYGDLLSTGASATTEKYHIFDLAGNLWEWTEENSTTSSDGQYRICRGRELPLFSLSSSCLLSRWSYYNR